MCPFLVEGRSTYPSLHSTLDLQLQVGKLLFKPHLVVFVISQEFDQCGDLFAPVFHAQVVGEIIAQILRQACLVVDAALAVEIKVLEDNAPILLTQST